MLSAPDMGRKVLRFVLASRPDAVRETLARIRTDFDEIGLAAEDFGLCEIVLAEVLNNIVEHAYAERDDGEIRIDLTIEARRIRIHCEDRGAGMPDGRLPEGTPADLDVPSESLPEGGFGWFLIHSITEELHYQRLGQVNFLDLTIPLPEL